jgi:hypothetical protein
MKKFSFYPLVQLVASVAMTVVLCQPALAG